MRGGHGFDRLAGCYRVLEYLAFGRDLERARFAHLHLLRDCRAILVLGEGDGRCLERLVGLAPRARIDCIDASGAMLARAGARIAGTEAAGRVAFRQLVLPSEDLPAGPFDAVVTLFFLDCFRADEAVSVMSAVEDRLLPGALWLWSDFALPAAGPARWRARLWLAMLYGFFRATTGLSAHRLPPMEAFFAARSYACLATAGFQSGLVRSIAWRHAKTR